MQKTGTWSCSVSDKGQQNWNVHQHSHFRMSVKEGNR